MTHKHLSDITGVDLCADKKTSIDITDKQLFALLQEKHPEAAQLLLDWRGGEDMHIPLGRDKRAAVMRWPWVRLPPQHKRAAGRKVAVFPPGPHPVGSGARRRASPRSGRGPLRRPGGGRPRETPR